MRIIPNKPLIDFNENLEFIKEYDYDHLIDRLYIHWDLLTKCNFLCSYCYAKRQYKENWNKYVTFNKQKFIIGCISKSELPVFLGLLGGEPTLDPNFLEIYELIQHQIMSKSPENRLYITTNGSTNVFKNLKYYKNTYILWSCHFEFKEKYGKNFEKFLNNIKISINKGFKNRVNLLLNPEKKYYNDTLYIFNELKKLNVEIHPHFLFEDDKLFEYTEDFFENFKTLNEMNKNFIFETKDGYIKLNDYTIFKNKLNNFKGWKCYNNNYEISYDGKVKNMCKLNNFDLLKNPLFFKKITKIEPVICNYNECNCDTLLRIYKEK